MRFQLKRKLSVVCASLFLLCGMATAQASFIIDPAPGGTQINLTNGNMLLSTTGTVGSETIGIASGSSLFSAAAGNATIKPESTGHPPVESPLLSLTFTPVNDTAFDAFSFRGQLYASAGGQVALHWVANDNSFGDFLFTGLGANADFSRVGIHSIDGETLKSVTITAGGEGFKQAKQFDFNLVTTSPVPEPSSLALLGLGVVGAAVGAYRRRKASA